MLLEPTLLWKRINLSTALYSKYECSSKIVYVCVREKRTITDHERIFHSCENSCIHWKFGTRLWHRSNFTFTFFYSLFYSFTLFDSAFFSVTKSNWTRNTPSAQKLCGKNVEITSKWKKSLHTRTHARKPHCHNRIKEEICRNHDGREQKSDEISVNKEISFFLEVCSAWKMLVILAHANDYSANEHDRRIFRKKSQNCGIAIAIHLFHDIQIVQFYWVLDTLYPFDTRVHGIFHHEEIIVKYLVLLSGTGAALRRNYTKLCATKLVLLTSIESLIL